MVAEAEVKGDGTGDITVPGASSTTFSERCRKASSVELSLNGDRLTIKAGRSRFTLSTLRAADFPTIDEIGAKQTLRLNRADLRRLVEKTHFSMAQQDVRYYLNGLLLETEKKRLRAVATDGHRLALSEVDLLSAATSRRATDRPAQRRARAQPTARWRRRSASWRSEPITFASS